MDRQPDKDYRRRGHAAQLRASIADKTFKGRCRQLGFDEHSPYEALANITEREAMRQTATKPHRNSMRGPSGILAPIRPWR